MSFDAGRDVVRALCVFYYEESELGEKSRNSMRDEAVKSQFYYEKSALGEKSRNRMRDEAVKKIVLLREKGENA